MMAETIPSPHVLPATIRTPSTLSHLSPGTKPANSSTPRKTRPLSNSTLDAFHAPAEVLNQSHYRLSTDQHNHTSSPAEPPNVQHLDVSPRNIPVSFQTFHPLPTNVHNPTLTIRKSASSTSLPPGSLDPSTFNHQHVHEMSVSPRSQALPAFQSSRNESAVTSESPTPNSSTEHIRFRAPFSDEEFPIPVEQGRRMSCEANTCSHHHHRQSRSSTVSISCHSSPPPGQLTHLESEVAAEIAMHPMPTEMLVPLIDRPEEMKELLENPRNEMWAHRARSVLGKETWEKRCLPLWTGTGRTEMSDREWLKRSKEILVRRGGGGVGDRQLWCEFCAMVGWDVEEETMLEGVSVVDAKGKRRASDESLQSASSGSMSSIAESDDEGIMTGR